MKRSVMLLSLLLIARENYRRIKIGNISQPTNDFRTVHCPGFLGIAIHPCLERYHSLTFWNRGIA